MLITDYARPFYEDYILPYGRLREGPGAYKRAHTILVSKCPPSLARKEGDAMIAKIDPLPGQQVFFSTISYGRAYDLLQREGRTIQGRISCWYAALHGRSRW